MAYSDKFVSAEAAVAYDSAEYSSSSVGNLLWEMEKDILRELLHRLTPNMKLRYLDFACGTGRIVSFIAPFAVSSTGIDISAEMLTLARKRSPETHFFCKDISSEDTVEGTYNLVTSFRFLSNVDPQTRRAALLALRARMEPEAILVINTHTNPLSYKMFFLAWHTVRGIFGGNVHTRYLSTNTMRQILNETGFEVVETIGYGFIPGKLLRLLSWNSALALERFFFRIPLLRTFGVNQIAVCRRTI